MCRLMAYIGHPMLVADVVLWPDRSIIKQSYDARERLQDPSLPFHLGFGNLNGDGFGIGWFNTEERREVDPSPCMFKSITPAWNNENLARLSTKIVSPVIFAHVRAAYPGMPVSEQNCHPFQFGRYLWMHNGVVGGFNCVRRHLLSGLSDAAYNTVQSFHSDSAVSFSIFLNALPDMCTQQPPDVLLHAMQDTVAAICRAQRECGVAETSLLNFVVSDGTTMVATRFVSPESGGAATLYYAEGSTFSRQLETPFARANSVGASLAAGGSPTAAAGGTAAAAAAAAAAGGSPRSPLSDDGTPNACRAIAGTTSAVGSSVMREASYSIAYGERGSSVAFIASEPITGSNTDWVAVPKNTALVITREKGGYINIMRSPLIATPPAGGPDPVQQEVATCLEAVIRGIATRGRSWVAKRGAGGSGTGELAADPMASMTRTISAELPPAAAEEDHRLTGHGGAVLAVAVDEGGRRLYSACTDAAVRVWDLETMQCSHVLRGHSKPVTQLRLARGRLYTAAGGAIRVWDTATLRLVDRIQTSLYSGGIRSLLVTDDGTIFVGHSDTTVKMYRTDPSAAAAAAAAAGNGGAAAAAAAPAAAAAGQPAASSPLARHPSSDANGASPPPSPRSRLSSLPPRPPSATGGLSAALRGGGAGSPAPATPPLKASALAAAGSGGVLGGAAVSPAVSIDEGALPPRWSCGGPAAARAPVAAAATAAAAAAAVVERAPDAVTDTACGHVGPVNSLVVVGAYICSAGGDAMVRVWRASDLSLVRVLRGHRGSVLCLLALGHLLLSGARDNAIRVWDMEMDMMCRRTLLGHKDDVTSLAAVGLRRRAAEAAAPPLSPLGSPLAGGGGGGGGGSAMLAALVASASADGTVRLWCAPTWTCLRVLVPSAPLAGLLGPATVPAPYSQQYHIASLASAGAFAQAHAAAGPAASAGPPPAPATPALPWAAERPPVPPQHAAGAAAALRLPHAVAPLRIGHSSFASFDFSGDDFSFGGSHASRPGALPSPAGPAAAAAGAASPAQQQVGFYVAPSPGAHAHAPAAPAPAPPAPPPGATPAALCVSVARGVIAAGFVDGAVRLWHVDDVCGAAAEAVGRSLPSTPPLGGDLEGTLSMTGGYDLRSFLSHPASGLLAGASPPASPRVSSDGGGGAAAAPPGSLLPAHARAAAAGAGAAASPEPPPQALAASAGGACARLRAGSWAVAGAAAAAAAAAGGAAEAAPSGHCRACGSMDQQLVRALRELVAIRTVSSSQKLRDECLRGAKYLARLLEGLGCEVRLAAHAEGKNPVVMGRLGRNPSHPTVVFYGHYDTQPALEPDWATRPYELTAADGYLYGRGTSDNKGPVLAFIYAVKEMLDCWQSAGSAAPVNVAFIIEGEEENGSTGFLEALQANLGWFSDADVVVISNTVWVGERLPCLTYGMRGMVTASIEVSGPARDVHSGNDGGVFSEPMADLFKLLASLTAAPGGASAGAAGGGEDGPGGGGDDGAASSSAAASAAARPASANGRGGANGAAAAAAAEEGDDGDGSGSDTAVSIGGGRVDGGGGGGGGGGSAGCACDGGAVGTRISIPGFYDGVRPRLIDLAWAGLEECDEFSMDTYKRAIGVPRLTAPPNKHDLLVARWCQPSLSVVEVRSGGVGLGGADERSLYRFGPTRFSVIPRTAVGKVSIRFVPEQDADHLIRCLTRHVRAEFARLGSANAVAVHVHSVGDWWEADPESDVFKMAERAVRREWGVAPLYVREGGTMPVASLIEKTLGAPALMIPMGQSSDACHLANERLRRLNLVKGKNVVRHLMEELIAARASAPGHQVAEAAACGAARSGSSCEGVPSALAPP
ncbi:hypothetical protein Rsub_05760 [Raphidocelis subcapitata]|uniref:Glutamine amidotransferase type-2 domain-containing protein n=1 Tax=Raphidocelis subcapitata TaxID=307507 RepID=A0A2V0NZ65_9CHLO|nr:hypothetical protein Rsub_05760 [Raphidocelis subcapitata]|eukprot:GBF92924.1 hypothetical protein Rsub_05760 [Raphidocelis subcapitata]